MTHVVAKPCFACKYTDCVVVCPVECFYEGEQMLYIHPDECIDCEACVPECPVDAIFHEDNVPEEWTRVHRPERGNGSSVSGDYREERAVGRLNCDGRCSTRPARDQRARVIRVERSRVIGWRSCLVRLWLDAVVASSTPRRFSCSLSPRRHICHGQSVRSSTRAVSSPRGQGRVNGA